MGMMLDQIMTVIGQTLIVVAVSFIMLCLLVSYARFHLLFTGRRPSAAAAEGVLDPFRACILKQLGSIYRNPEPFAVMTLRATDGGHRPEDPVARIRGMIRASDMVMRYDENQIGMIIKTSRKHAERVAQRVADGLPGSPAIGIATCPENGTRLSDLLENAEHAAEEAGRLSGGVKLAGEPVTAPDEGDILPAQAKYLDDLTGVLRGDLLGRTLPKFISQHRKEGRTVAMIYCDVDNFQDYNQHYSREAGDALLQGVSRLFQENLREDDLIARYSGDEFLILFPAAAADAQHTARRLSAVIKRAEFKYGAITLKTTVSMGIALVPGHARTLSRLFEAASHALHAAKQKGVGFCVMYAPGMGVQSRTQDVIEKF